MSGFTSWCLVAEIGLAAFINCLIRTPCKLRPVGLLNQIMDDSDSKLSEFEHQFWTDSKSDDKIVLNRINLFSIKIYLLLIKRSKKSIKKFKKVDLKSIKRSKIIYFNQKSQNKSKNNQIILTFLYKIDHFWSISNDFKILD